MAPTTSAGAEAPQFGVLRRPRTHGSDFCAAQCGELDRKLADAAGSARDEQALRRQRLGELECARDGEAGDRQRRRHFGRDALGDDGGAGDRHRDALGPAAGVEQGDDARAGRGARAELRGRDHGARDVPAGHGPLGRARGAADFAAIERDGLDMQQQLVRPGRRLRYVGERKLSVFLLPGFHGVTPPGAVQPRCQDFVSAGGCLYSPKFATNSSRFLTSILRYWATKYSIVSP